MKKSSYRMEAINSDLMDSSFDGESISSEGAATLAQVGKGLFEKLKTNKTDYQKNLKAACGSSINIRKKAKDEYAKCVSDYDNRQMQMETEKAKIAQADSDAKVAEANVQERLMSQESNNKTPKKFLGMPMGVGIVVTVLATAAIGLIVYKKVLKR